MLTQNKRLIGIISAVAILLALPLIAMQFTNEVSWKVGDFIIGGVLLLGTGLVCELILRKVKSVKYRIVLCAAILVTLALVWLELAVGIFGSPIAGS